MKFTDWKILNEYLDTTYLSKEAEKVASVISKISNKFFAVPNFETFKRPQEPEQQSNLFTDDKLRTFAINYTTKGSLYSIDVWKADSIKPIVTYYIKQGTTEDVAKIIPDIVENPGKRIDISKVKTSKDKVLQESEIVIEPEKPKPAATMDPIVTKAEKASHDDEYEYSDPDTIFKDLETYIKMVIDGTQPSLLITGSPGVGKTFTILKMLKEAGLKKGEDFLHVKGRSTAAGMFITLYENNGKIIVFDDCDSVFKDDNAVNILKGALDSYGEREISWLVGRPLKTSDGTEVPKSFTFTGKVIFISNLPQKKIDDAIKSRSFVIEVALTPEDMLKKMRKDLPNVNPEVPLGIRENAMDFIEEVSANAKNLELNMRTLVKAIKILRIVTDLEIAERLILQQCSYK